MTTKEEFIDNCTKSDNGKKITFYDYRYGGSTKEISEGILLICDSDNTNTNTNKPKLIQFINDNPIDGSMEKYGEILYGQKQRWYYYNSDLRILKIEDLKEPLKKTEQDFYKQFLGKDVSFTVDDKKVIQGKIEEVLEDRIKLSNNPKVFRYDYIAVPPAVESPAAKAPSKDVEVRPPEPPPSGKKGFVSSLFNKGGKQSKSRKQRKSRKQHKSRKQRKSRK